MKKKCLLLGGAGFIGKNLALYLLEQGYELTVYDMSVTHAFTEEQLQQMKYYERELFKDEDLESVIEGQDVVIHLVSSINPATSMIHPERCYANDVAKTVEILEIMRKKNVNKMIFISSGGTVYGNIPKENYTEDMPLYPRNHYGITKATIEKIILMYNQIYKMDHVILRIANPYGRGQMSKKGVGAVTAFAEQILADEEISIWGDGSTVRDYIYIEDVVNMIGKFIEYHNDSDNEVYNIGTGRGISLNELVALLEEKIGKKAKVVYEHNREIDAQRNVLNMDKTFGAIGNVIQYPIEKGISRYLEILKEEGH